MDLYGAFQVCSIGILLAPVTLMLSRSYFAQAGSSIIILWTALILAGEYSFRSSWVLTLAHTYSRPGELNCGILSRQNLPLRS